MKGKIEDDSGWHSTGVSNADEALRADDGDLLQVLSAATREAQADGMLSVAWYWAM